MKTERKWIMTESKWSYEMLLIKKKASPPKQQQQQQNPQILGFSSLVSVNSEELCWKLNWILLFSYFHVGMIITIQQKTRWKKIGLYEALIKPYD